MKKTARKKKGHIGFIAWCIMGKSPLMWVSKKKYTQIGEMMKSNKRKSEINVV